MDPNNLPGFGQVWPQQQNAAEGQSQDPASTQGKRLEVFTEPAELSASRHRLSRL